MKDRHQCEVRHVLKLRCESQERAREYLEKVEKARGTGPANRLKREAAEQWGLGNRGQWEDWRDEGRKDAVHGSGPERKEAA